MQFLRSFIFLLVAQKMIDFGLAGSSGSLGTPFHHDPDPLLLIHCGGKILRQSIS